jgi:hypothetical protein
VAQYSEWPAHKRTIKINKHTALIEDRFFEALPKPCEWRLHFAPEWKIEGQSKMEYRFVASSGDHLNVSLRGSFESVEAKSYDFSPSYGVAVPAAMLHLSASTPEGVFAILMTIDRK